MGELEGTGRAWGAQEGELAVRYSKHSTFTIRSRRRVVKHTDADRLDTQNVKKWPLARAQR